MFFPVFIVEAKCNAVFRDLEKQEKLGCHVDYAIAFESFKSRFLKTREKSSVVPGDDFKVYYFLQHLRKIEPEAKEYRNWEGYPFYKLSEKEKGTDWNEFQFQLFRGKKRFGFLGILMDKISNDVYQTVQITRRLPRLLWNRHVFFSQFCGSIFEISADKPREESTLFVKKYCSFFEKKQERKQGIALNEADPNIFNFPSGRYHVYQNNCQGLSFC